MEVQILWDQGIQTMEMVSFQKFYNEAIMLTCFAGDGSNDGSNNDFGNNNNIGSGDCGVCIDKPVTIGGPITIG
jgi:hypothetical protein